jgi:hypothetical protein
MGKVINGITEEGKNAASIAALTQEVESQLADMATKSELNEETAARLAEVAVERARITNLATLSEGSTTGDAELIDIRVGVDGKIYETAGNAVRTQIKCLADALFMTDVTGTIQNGYYITVNGNIQSNNDYQVTDYIAVKPNDIIIYTGVSGVINGAITNIAVALYDSSKRFLEPLIDVSDLIIGTESTRYLKTNAVAKVPDYEKTLYIRCESAYDNQAGANLPKADVKVRKISAENNKNETIDIDDMIDGIGIKSTGEKFTNPDYVSKENIPVIPGQKMYLTGYFGGSVITNNPVGVAGKDINKNWIMRVFDNTINGNLDDEKTQYIRKEITIPSGVYFIDVASRKDGAYPILYEFENVTSSMIADNLWNTLKQYTDNIIYNNYISYQDEIANTVQSVESILATSNKPMLTFAVFTDLHHPQTTNSPVKDMFGNINDLNGRLNFDFIANLGDTIDGQFQTKAVAEGYLRDVMENMYDITAYAYALQGNHDDNVQSTWADTGNLSVENRLTNLELASLINKRSRNKVYNSARFTDYYVDYPEFDIRVIFISADYTTFTTATSNWLSNIALNTTHKVLVLSHIPTKPEWGYLNDINNGERIETPLNNFVANGGTIIAYIHGHTHGDMIETASDLSFTEVAIGCAKFETLTAGTTGITYQPRSASDYTKVLFDVVCIDQTNRKLHLIRFGAGEDRVISY